MGKKEPKTAPLGMRITKTMKVALGKAAEAEGRSMADFAARVLAEHLKRTGYLV